MPSITFMEDAEVTTSALRDLWDDMRPAERAATITSGVGFLITTLLLPSSLCWWSGRPLATGLGAHFFEIVLLELLSSVTLVLAPLKAKLKPYVHGDETREPVAAPLRWLLQLGWITSILGLLAVFLPQLFFVLTGRDVATGLEMWLRDAASMGLALLPVVASIGPWIWATRRVHARHMARDVAEEAA